MRSLLVCWPTSQRRACERSTPRCVVSPAQSLVPSFELLRRRPRSPCALLHRVRFSPATASFRRNPRLSAQAILSWFAEKARLDAAVALLWTLYYLVRGRNAEALVSQRLGAAAAEESLPSELRAQRASVLEMLRVASRCVPAPLGEVAVVVDPTVQPGLEQAPAQLPPGAIAFAELLTVQSDANRSVAMVTSGPTLLEVPLVGDAAALRTLMNERNAAASDAPAAMRSSEPAPRELATLAPMLGGAAPASRAGFSRPGAPTAFSKLTGSVLWAR